MTFCFAFTIAKDFGKFVSYETDHKDLFFSIMEVNDKVKIPGKSVCTFWAEDIDKLYNKVVKLNILVDTQLFTAPFGRTFAIRDIDGNKIEFVQF